MPETVNSPPGVLSCVCNDYIRKGGSKAQFSWFTCILYPQEDDRHKKFMSYMQSDLGLFPKSIYIWHDRDRWSPAGREKYLLKNPDKPIPEVGSLKKPHIHFIFKRSVKCPVSTISSYFGCWVREFQAVTDLQDYIRYCAHLSPECFDDEYKYPYGFGEFKGNIDVIKEFIIQNANSVLFFDLIDMICYSETGTEREFLQNIRSLDPVLIDDYLKCYKDNQYVINRLIYEVSSMKKDEAYASSFFAEGWKTDEGEDWKSNYYYNNFIRRSVLNTFDPEALKK